MTYSDAKGLLILFSPDRAPLERCTSSVREKLDRKGCEYQGPFTPPPVEWGVLGRFLHYLDDPDDESTGTEDEFQSWLFSIANSEQNVEALVATAEDQETLFSRQFRIFGQDPIAAALKFELPDSVFAAAELSWREHWSGSGHDPTTWDPNVDHIPSHPVE